MAKPIDILVVDDERPFAETLAKRLTSRDYHALPVFGGEAALKILKTDAGIDVVILDISMPGIDGLEVLKYIKADWPLVEVILLTGAASVQTAVDGIGNGAFSYLVKPADLEALVRVIEQAAARKKRHEHRILEIRMKPYTTAKERQAAISEVESLSRVSPKP